MLLCSTGTMIGRPNGRNWRLLAECGDKLRCDGYEFMMYDTWYDQVDRIAPFMRGLSLAIPTFHCEKCIGEEISLHSPEEWDGALEKFEINCQLASFLGAGLMVFHLWDGVTSDRHMERNLTAYPLLKRRAQAHGIRLTVENVVCGRQDPLTHWRELLDRDPEAELTFDTKMAAFHDQLTAMYAPENGDLWRHIAHLHVNDYAGGYLDWAHLRTLHIGRGKLDFESLFAFLRKIGYHGHYTVEATSFLPDGVIHWDELNATLDRVRAYMDGK